MKKVIINCIALIAFSYCFSPGIWAQTQNTRTAPPSLPTGIRAARNVEYARINGKPLLLDIYYPENAKGPLPLVVWVHGGAWLIGNKDRTPALFLTGSGYVVASINYRFTDEAIFPAQIFDCKSAIRWLRANAKLYGIDKNRIGVWGGSAGGHLVALLGTSGGVRELEGDVGVIKQSSRVQAVCDWYGPTDLIKISQHPAAGNERDPYAAIGPVVKLLGGPVSENKEKAAQASPITYITKDNPPFLIMHGSRDSTVPLDQSQIFYEALKRAGVDVTYHVIEGASHGGPGFNTPEVRNMVREFFDEKLKKH